ESEAHVPRNRKCAPRAFPWLPWGLPLRTETSVSQKPASMRREETRRGAPNLHPNVLASSALLDLLASAICRLARSDHPTYHYAADRCRTAPPLFPLACTAFAAASLSIAWRTRMISASRSAASSASRARRERSFSSLVSSSMRLTIGRLTTSLPVICRHRTARLT